MGTSANIYIKTKYEKLKYHFSMDGGFHTTGINMLSKLNYQKDKFLGDFTEYDKANFEDKYQNYIYYIDFEKPSMRVFEMQNGKPINIYQEVIQILEDGRRDLIPLIEEE